MDWITKEYVRSEAAKGRKQAIECTQLHWQQLVKAGPEELSDALTSDHTDNSEVFCAMCIRYLSKDRRNAHGKCYNCLLNCWKIWEKACDALDDWIDNPTRTNWRKWKQAANAVLAKIDRLHERLYGSKP